MAPAPPRGQGPSNDEQLPHARPYIYILARHMSPSGDKSTASKEFSCTWQLFWRSKDARWHWQPLWRPTDAQLAPIWRPFGIHLASIWRPCGVHVASWRPRMAGLRPRKAVLRPRQARQARQAGQLGSPRATVSSARRDGP